MLLLLLALVLVLMLVLVLSREGPRGRVNPRNQFCLLSGCGWRSRGVCSSFLPLNLPIGPSQFGARQAVDGEQNRRY
jgi:hypothetical protein